MLRTSCSVYAWRGGGIAGCSALSVLLEIASTSEPKLPPLPTPLNCQLVSGTAVIFNDFEGGCLMNCSAACSSVRKPFLILRFSLLFHLLRLSTMLGKKQKKERLHKGRGVGGFAVKLHGGTSLRRRHWTLNPTRPAMACPHLSIMP